MVGVAVNESSAVTMYVWVWVGASVGIPRELAVGAGPACWEAMDGAWVGIPNEEALIALQNHLANNGITAERPVELWNDNPSASQAYRTTLSLPLFPNLSSDDAAKVRDLISDYLSHV